MKKYGIIDAKTKEPVTDQVFDSLTTASRQADRMGSGLEIITWIGHIGYPAVAVIMRKRDEKIQAIFAYKEQATVIADMMNENSQDESFDVRTIILNTEFPS